MRKLLKTTTAAIALAIMTAGAPTWATLTTTSSNTKLQGYYTQTNKSLVTRVVSKGGAKGSTIDPTSVNDQMLLTIFRHFDTNGSGYIERTEFSQYMMNHFENVGAPMTSADFNRLFAKLDSGDRNRNFSGKNDGKLSYEEFAVLILSRMVF